MANATVEYKPPVRPAVSKVILELSGEEAAWLLALIGARPATSKPHPQHAIYVALDKVREQLGDERTIGYD